MNAGATKFMIAREKFHAARTADTAKAYADAALVETDFGGDGLAVHRAAVLVAVANELDAASCTSEALRVRAEAEKVAK